MKWTDKKIVEWHKKTFPDCTYESQLAKLDEELNEVSEAQKKGNYVQSFDELADVYIVATVLKERFNSTIGGYFIGLLEGDPVPSLFERVDRKMDINAKRTWQKVNGVYRHINKKIDYIGGKKPDSMEKPLQNVKKSHNLKKKEK